MTFQTQFPQLLQRIKADSPLIHCITNHISIHDCANALLALGASPIMAEHPGEVAEITATSQALMVNLGNISDSRMEAIAAAGETARTHHIPCMIDLVGVGCSKLRRSFAHGFLLRAHPAVIKGNESEIRAICGVEHHARGIDNGEHGSGDGHRMYAGRCRGSFSRCRFSIGGCIVRCRRNGVGGRIRGGTVPVPWQHQPV